GLVRLALAGDLAGRTVDLGSGQLEPVRSVAERIARLTGASAPLQFDPAADRPLEQVRAADVEQTARLTGWRPRIGLDEGLQQTIAWHRARGAKNP
ncbi:MAG TPA: NAD-dependent dehydratase, partial [Verrucomicrobia bacterium]|nr:NAD-dependent dehydratase [Verrucomicrobiota bacterium]